MDNLKELGADIVCCIACLKCYDGDYLPDKDRATVTALLNRLNEYTSRLTEHYRRKGLDI